METASTAYRMLNRTLRSAVAGLLAVILILTVVQVFLRYVVGFSFLWYEEVARLLHMWMIMLGAVVATHIRIEFVLDRLDGAKRLALNLMHALISIVALGIMVKGAVDLTQLTWGDRFVSINVSASFLFVSLIVAGALWILVILYRFAASVQAQREGTDDT